MGNRLPDPATLFLIGTVLVMIASAVAVKSGWVVHERLPDHSAALGQAADGSQAAVKWLETGRTFEANNILTRDGLFWAISSMVENFINFAPLGIVLVGMLGARTQGNGGITSDTPPGRRVVAFRQGNHRGCTTHGLLQVTRALRLLRAVR